MSTDANTDDSDSTDEQKYIAMVSANAGVYLPTIVNAEDEDDAKEKLENVNAGVLGPAEVGPIEEI